MAEEQVELVVKKVEGRRPKVEVEKAEHFLTVHKHSMAKKAMLPAKNRKDCYMQLLPLQPSSVLPMMADCILLG